VDTKNIEIDLQKKSSKAYTDIATQTNDKTNEMRIFLSLSQSQLVRFWSGKMKTMEK
jgi:putative sterol carrier protein